MTLQHGKTATWRGWRRVVGLLLVVLGASAAMGAQAPRRLRLPVLHNLGVIPVQWVGGDGWQDDAALVEKVETYFPEVVRASRRFRVISDELVSGLWSSPAGREELRTEYELQGYMNLSVQRSGDVVMLAASLLGPKLDLYLTETETVPRLSMTVSDEARLRGVLEHLVFRVINRIPTDVHVTSLQGRFVTLTGGREQDVRAGDQVEIWRVVLASVHPANGSWLEFDHQKLGRAKVVQVNEHTSVAEMTELAYDGAIAQGDGARVPAIAGRRKFALVEEHALAAREAERARGVVSAIPAERILGPRLAEAVAEDETGDARGDAEGDEENAGGLTVSSDGKRALPGFLERSSDLLMDTGQSFASGTLSLVDRVIGINKIHTWGGTRVWSVSGAASTGGKFPLWLLNHFGIGAGSELWPRVFLMSGAHFGFGATRHGGSFTSYGAQSTGYYQGDAFGDGMALGYWFAGARLRLQGLGVGQEVFGGGDWLEVGGVAGLKGKAPIGESIVDWTTEVGVTPMVVGRIGYGGKMRTVRSSLGWDLGVEGIQQGVIRDFEWGMRVGYGNQSLYLSDGKELGLGTYEILGIARFRF